MLGKLVPELCGKASFSAIQLETLQRAYLGTPGRIDSAIILRRSRWDENPHALAEVTRKSRYTSVDDEFEERNRM